MGTKWDVGVVCVVAERSSVLCYVSLSRGKTGLVSIGMGAPRFQE